MKKFITLGVFAAFALASTLGAQSILTPTTLTSAATISAKVINVTSATPNTISADNFAVGNGVIIGNSYGLITSVSGLVIGVNWANSSGTQNRDQASGALVWTARANFLSTKTSDPTGSCTRTQLQVLPVINAVTGNSTDCLGGKWVSGPRTVLPPWRVTFPDPGGVLYTGINTNGTAVGATTLYCSEFNLKTSKLLTGLEVLNGTTVTGNARYVILYDSAGNALANSALAGQASVTASVYEQYAFTKAWYATGPAQYFGCLQDNAGGSTTVRMSVTGQADQMLTKGQTGATFGTVPTLTVPTTYTTAVGPLMGAY